MHLIFCLNHVLTEFRPLFNRQNFALFCTFILGLITHRRQASLTEIYQAVRPKKYGKRLKLRRLRYKPFDINNRRYAIASAVVQTKMCPTKVRLVVIRTRHQKTKAFRYFCVFTTDLTLDVCQIVRYHRQRWLIETAFRDIKQHFGFDTYRVKSYQSINRFVQLSFVASCLIQWLFYTSNAKDGAITVEQVCSTLGIDWYRPPLS